MRTKGNLQAERWEHNESDEDNEENRETCAENTVICGNVRTNAGENVKTNKRSTATRKHMNHLRSTQNTQGNERGESGNTMNMETGGNVRGVQG